MASFKRAAMSDEDEGEHLSCDSVMSEDNSLASDDSMHEFIDNDEKEYICLSSDDEQPKSKHSRLV